jgi:transcriptional regulator of arginine metabolism
MKAGRQRKIVGVLREMPVTSQTQLVKILRSAGYPATQATVSRDLDALGAVKVRRDGKVAYALPGDSATVPAGDAYGRMFADSILDLESTGNLIVVKTPPGHAGMVGGALDRIGIEGVAGTVAGDDTIIVICKQGVMPRKVERRLRSLVEALPELDDLEEDGEE